MTTHPDTGRIPGLIALIGGIGSGKSVVSRVLRAKGYYVYDCDSRARRLMDADPEIRRRIAHEISPACINSQGTILRRVLAEIVFNDPESLRRLNAITHGVVRRDLRRWCLEHAHAAPLFVETAILFESGLDAMVSGIWEVTAPVDLRIERVVSRGSGTIVREEVEQRISCQSLAIDRAIPEGITYRTIINDNIFPLLPQVNELLLGQRSE